MKTGVGQVSQGVGFWAKHCVGENAYFCAKANLCEKRKT